MKLPEDPMMLYSFINMKLRDFYPSLDALCEDMNVDLSIILHETDSGNCCKLINREVGAVSWQRYSPNFLLINAKYAPPHLTSPLFIFLTCKTR